MKPPELPHDLVTLVLIADDDASLGSLGSAASVCRAWSVAAAEAAKHLQLIEYEYTLGCGMGSSLGRFNRPEGVCRALHGHVWVADTCNHRLQCLARDESTAVGGGRSGFLLSAVAEFRLRGEMRGVGSPRHLVSDGEHVYMSTDNGSVYKLDSEWESLQLRGAPRCASPQLLDMAVAGGRLYLLTRDLDAMVRVIGTEDMRALRAPNDRPVVFPDFQSLLSVSGHSALVQPAGIAIHEQPLSEGGAEVYVLDAAARRRTGGTDGGATAAPRHSGGVLAFSAETRSLLRHFLLPRPPGLARLPCATALAAVRGRLLVGEERRVQVLSRHGAPLQLVVLPKGVSASLGLGGMCEGDGCVYAADATSSRVHLFRMCVW